MKTPSDIPEHLRDRAWFIENSAYAFLVHAPIAFGHSQLTVSLAHCIDEEDAFSLAAKHIAICIGRFRSIFVSLPEDTANSLENRPGNFEFTRRILNQSQRAYSRSIQVTT